MVSVPAEVVLDEGVPEHKSSPDGRHSRVACAPKEAKATSLELWKSAIDRGTETVGAGSHPSTGMDRDHAGSGRLSERRAGTHRLTAGLPLAGTVWFPELSLAVPRLWPEAGARLERKLRML